MFPLLKISYDQHIKSQNKLRLNFNNKITFSRMVLYELGKLFQKYKGASV